MNNFFSNKRLIVILISVILIVSLLAFSLSNSGNVNVIQRSVNDITAFVGRAVSVPVNGVMETFDDITDLKNTYEENQTLKAEFDTIQQTESRITALEEEKAALEAELNLQNSLSDYATFSATVISRNPDSWMQTITINRGENDGIEIDMPVLSQDGLIGRISEVNPTSSKVTLLTTSDQTTNLVSSEIISEDGEVIHGVIEGYDEETQRLVMNNITSDAEITEGQEVTTSGLSDKTPRSLIIGTVDEVTYGDFGLTQRVYLTPAADFNDVRYVTVVNRALESGE